MQNIKGMVSDIIYKNNDNGYTVFEVICDEDVYTAVGTVFDLNIGEKISIYGDFFVHPQYGHQLKVSYIEKLLPESRDELFLYLSSGAIKGIGKKLAKKVINTFGDDTLRILQEEPERLLEIKGITKAKVENIKRMYAFQKFLKEIMETFSRYGLNQNYAMRLFKIYGFSAIGLLNDNPYFLLDVFNDLDFKKVDKIAIDKGIEKNDPRRISAKILYILNQAANIEGHTNLVLDNLLSIVSRDLDVDEEEIKLVIENMQENKRVKKVLIEGSSRIYLYNFFEYENYIAKKLLRLKENFSQINDIQKNILEFEKDNNIYFSSNQKKAIEMALNEGVCVITGGPGTGKTTIIKCIIEILEKNNKTVFLCAPTGRAAKRMSMQSNKEAKTIHRLLEMVVSDSNVAFGRGPYNPLQCDVVIIDEISMADVSIMYFLLLALKDNAKVIMVGDADQLPPVGAGNVLKDLIKSGVIPYVKLTEIYRQSEKSLIVLNAHKINNGEMPVLKPNSDFYFLERNTEKEITETIIELVCQRLPKYLNANPVVDIQVLCPSRKGLAGMHHLNKLLQERLNPKTNKTKEVVFKENVFRLNDKVMQIKNNYSIEYTAITNNDLNKNGSGIFNGDIGFINEINKDEGYMKIIFDDEKVVEYDLSLLDDLELSYSMTVHKSQGSEFRCIVMPIYKTYPILMTRNLLYTAVTRAKEMVVLVGTKLALKYMINNQKEAMRYSGLYELLRLGEQI
ncbi:ATP-dependent RecD-like DNA helicase [Caldicellulosiruptoraceae bacterium PP1]